MFRAVALLTCLVPGLAGASESVAGGASVIDGDTIEIHGQRIRFWGVDAPESRQSCGDPAWRCGQQAALALADKIGRQTVQCYVRDTDRYKRLVAICGVGDDDLNRWLVREGWAVDAEKYSHGAYAAEQAEAKAAKRRIWSGLFVEPADFRKRK